MIPSGKAKLAGVIGWPVGHSSSPRLHGYWLEHYGIDGAYVPLGVEPANFERVLQVLPLLGFVGVNVTVPHKEAALAAVDVADPLAQRIGAVNTVIVRRDGGLEGRNSDAYGFLENIKTAAPGWDAASGPAVVLGADGAPEVRVVNRTAARAEALAAAIGSRCRVLPWSERCGALDGAGLLVNATTLGMTGQPPLDLDLDRLPRAAVVNDVVYAPLETALLKMAARRGNRTVDGLGMLLHQARPGFKAWFGVEPEVTSALRAFLSQDPAG